MLVLIVEDDEVSRVAMREYLKISGYEVQEARRTEEALELADVADVVLLGVASHRMNGVELIRHIRSERSDCLIFVLTTHDDSRIVREVVEAGADDLIKKPVNLEFLKLKIEHALKTRNFHSYRNRYLLSLKEKLLLLEEVSVGFFDERADLFSEMLEILNLLSEYRDSETYRHTKRVGWLSGRIAEEMGLDENFVTEIRFAGLLHDIGKVAIPDRILLKPGALTEEEFEVIKKHTIVGYKILSKSKPSILRLGAEVALTHHERWDGSGYPNGLKGKEIPVSGLIVSVADSFDAMVSKRPYRKPKTFEEAFQEIETLSGRYYSPEVVEAFLKLERDVVEVYGKGE